MDRQNNYDIILDIGYMFESTFDFKNSDHFNSKNKTTQKFGILVISIFLHRRVNARLLYTSLDLNEKILCDQIWVPPPPLA